MIDIRIGPHLDLTLGSVQQKVLDKIATKKYDAIILSPPCSTFSRAPWSNRNGPRPLRSFCKPRGFDRLTPTEANKAKWGNSMADFSFKVCKLVLGSSTMLLFENPEDLGALQHGEHQGERPASMWQWDEFSELLESGEFQTVVFYQQDFGTPYLKPTRLLLKRFSTEHEAFYSGPAQFNEQGFYVGPRMNRVGFSQLVQNNGHLNFANGLRIRSYPPTTL